jgi:hypothetical protein
MRDEFWSMPNQPLPIAVDAQETKVREQSVLCDSQ